MPAYAVVTKNAQQPHLAGTSNIPQDTVSKIQSILGWPATKEQIIQAKCLVPDPLFCHKTSFTPVEALPKVQEYINHGATCPTLYPAGGSVRLLIDTFADYFFRSHYEAKVIYNYTYRIFF